ncbi:hypothetical protein EV127DRAFT_476637 [Xylaria flabelliformis]|nr:hypothetical protein EV127DRAFT_476637 [Xylaria flabelliformis]
MTDQVSGSSLPQTRDLRQQHQQQHQQPQEQQEQDQHRRHTHPHSRKVPSSHQHNSKRSNHNHSHNHQHLHHVRSQQNSEPHQRDTSDDNADTSSDIVVVVETISVLQVTDLTGATIIKTLPHDYPTTPVITDSRSESTTVASSTKKPSSTDTDLPDTTSTSSASNDGNGVAHPSSSSSSTIEDPTVTPSGSSMPTSFPTLSYAPITATPLSAAPVFPSLSGHSNSTFSSSSSSSSSAFGNSSASLHSFTTSSEDGFSILGGATGTRSKTSSHPSSSVFTQSVFGTSTSKSSPSVTYTYLTATAKPEATTTGGGDGIGSPADTGSGDGSVPTSGAGSGSGSGNTSAGTIAGSVVGAISGLAIILLLAATFLRWKKRQSSMKLIQESGNDRGYGAMITGGSGGSGGGSGGMSEHRRPIPFAIPAALANLTSQRFSRSTVSSNGGERGFTKVSGRKLPPVIQFGGDGYTDPRATMMSDQSIDYRASQNFFGEAPLSRLAVGAPMLQETSTPVFHASPARTAIATPGPFSDPFSDDNRVVSPTLPPDPLGRSHLPQDRSTRSHGSFSRFTEDL